MVIVCLSERFMYSEMINRGSMAITLVGLGMTLEQMRLT